MNISQAIAEAKQQLGTLSDSVQADVEILLCHVLQCTRTFLHTWPEKKLTREQLEHYQSLISRRRNHQPVAYLTGKRGFWTFELDVNETTLIPRPETELLVETALEKIPADSGMQILDLGTGSGAIALAIAHERPDCTITAVDQSADALQIAKKNALSLALGNICFIQGNWLQAVPGQQYDLIVSNPPYIPEHDDHLSQGDAQHEPRTALASGHDGLDDIRHIISQAHYQLKPSSWLILEHGYDQQAAVRQLFEQEGYHEITQVKDLAGHARVSMAVKP